MRTLDNLETQHVSGGVYAPVVTETLLLAIALLALVA